MTATVTDVAVPTFGIVVLDCPDPAALAGFYARLLAWAEPETSDGEWVNLARPDGVEVIAFQRVADYRPPNWPSPDAPQQLHLDLRVRDLDAAHARAIDLGARLVDDSVATFRVYLDPAGHPFCLCAC